MSHFNVFDEYRKRLYPIGRGHALWSPSPQQIDGTRQPAVQIGDVGYIYDGRWTFLFNVHLTTGAEGQATRLPPAFYPLYRSGVSWSLLPDSSQWSVSGGSSRCISVGVSDSTGALSVRTPSISVDFSSEVSVAYIGEAEEEAVTKHALRRYVDYARGNLHHWRHFFAEQGMDLNISDLIIVTACTRASSWTNSVRISSSSEANLCVRASLNTLANIELTYQNRANVDMNVMHNSGPTYRTDDETAGFDQCLFVKGYKVSAFDQIQSALRSSFRRRRSKNHSHSLGDLGQAKPENVGSDTSSGAPSGSSDKPVGRPLQHLPLSTPNTQLPGSSGEPDSSLTEISSPPNAEPMRAVCQHRYPLKSRGKHFAFLTVDQSHALVEKDNPLFYYGEEVTGTISVSAENLEKISSMEVVLQEFAAKGVRSAIQAIASKKVDLSDSQATANPGQYGIFEWAFSLHSPPPPKSLFSPYTSPSPDQLYDLRITIYRRGILSRDLALTQRVDYTLEPTTPTPHTSPRNLRDPTALPSLSKQILADSAGISKLPPQVQPWKEVKYPAFRIKGMLFHTQQVEYTCMPTIPSFCYTSTNLPIKFTITSANMQAIFFITSNPSAIDIRLSKVFALGADHARLGRARQGEIVIDASMKIGPSVSYRGTSLMYTVNVYPFKMVGFAPAVSPDKVLFVAKVSFAHPLLKELARPPAYFASASGASDTLPGPPQPTPASKPPPGSPVHAYSESRLSSDSRGQTAQKGLFVQQQNTDPSTERLAADVMSPVGGPSNTVRDEMQGLVQARQNPTPSTDDSESLTDDLDPGMPSTSVDPDWKTDALEYIHETANVAFAIVHDDDLLPFLDDITPEKDLYDVLCERRPRVYIIGGKSGADAIGENAPTSSRTCP
ncbi:hypothetical protein K488DRAFT_89399 [Vararia minispora EC-137]|uniref:Uncharacterized protein n=1 Tax=Vararia minispora EC-137 TaxID=1314806 RepID=A0ACB8QAE7_9AGAM|nr:hypothetical protein K488DRAFT_89399 [Vararia minispora EC-137]